MPLMVVCSYYDDLAEKYDCVSSFADDYSSACSMLMDYALYYDGRAQIYIWDSDDNQYKLLEE